MKVIDARSGQEMQVGDVARYPDGEWTRLDAVYPGLLQTKAMLTVTTRDYASGQLRCTTFVAPLTVRYLHPGFLFQRVGFINT